MNQVNSNREGVLRSDPWHGGLSLVDVVRGLWAYRWSSIATVLGTTALAVFVALVSTPVYRAEVLLSPMGEDGPAGGGLSGIVRQLGDIGPLMGMGSFGSVGLKEETMALVKSRSFLIQFIHDEDLMPVLFPESATRDGKPTYGDGYRRFERSVLHIQEDQDTGLVRLAIEWPDPQVAAEWANKLVARINEHMRDRAISEAQRSIEYLQRELTKTSIIGIQDSIYRLIESHIGKITLANSRDGYAFRVIDPAVAPEEKEFVKPRRLLLVFLGGIGGSLLAFLVVVLRLVWRRSQ